MRSCADWKFPRGQPETGEPEIVGRGWTHLPSAEGRPTVHFEECMHIQEIYQSGMGQTQITRQLGFNCKTVGKYLLAPARPYGPCARRPWKLDPYRSYLRERGEQGMHNGHLHLSDLIRAE